MRFGLILSLLLLMAGCSTVPTSEVVSDLSTNTSLNDFYTQRSQTTLLQYWGPTFLGNLAEYRTDDSIHFADQTVYLGFFMAWQGLASMNDQTGESVANMTAAMNHMLTGLVVTTQVNGAANTGYFMRDNMSPTSLTIDGTSYAVSSDYQGGTNDEQSQDQIIHLLFGYSFAAKSLAQVTGSDAAAVRQQIVNHAHDIGVRLKANNYMVLTPQGQPVARGQDARAFAWPIATAVSRMTGQPLTTYLDGVDVQLRSENRTLHFTNDQLRDLFKSALDLIELGLCDLKYGEEKQDLCNRFVLALVNSLYVSSGYYEQNPTYVSRMDTDGDYIYAAASRALRNEKRVPKTYYEALTSVLDGPAFTSSTGPALWCQDNRWVRMPSICPGSSSAGYNYNALDFLSFYQVMANLDRLGQ